MVIAGDFNVIPAPEDVYNPSAWMNDALFAPQTRAHFQALVNLGLTDAFRACHDEPHRYTFWDYQAGAFQKNQGLRIDHLLLSPQAADRLQALRDRCRAAELGEALGPRADLYRACRLSMSQSCSRSRSRRSLARR